MLFHYYKVDVSPVDKNTDLQMKLIYYLGVKWQQKILFYIQEKIH